MFNFDDVWVENIKDHNPKWPQIPGHPFRILMIDGSGSGKTNALLNIINHQSQIYLYGQDPYETKY